jgi:hypothetical protein
MKQSLLIASAALGSSLAWEMDIRCPGYYTPPRMLQEGEEIFGNEDTDFYDANDMQQLDYIVLSPTTNNLRGAEEQSHRELQSSFQVKMNWEEGFCWQEEWIERQWCLSCQGKCGIGDPIWVQFCDVNDATQQFSYVPVAGSAGGQLKTASENLCLQHISSETFQLATCKNTDRQILFGFNTDGSPFELTVNGKPDMCLSNYWHHPKPGEIIYGSSCKDARINHTNKWQTYSGGSESNPATANDKSTLRSRKNKCTNCDTCEGNCDNDGQCSGDLKCFHRTGGQTQMIPGCFGPGTPAQGYCYNPPYTGDKAALRLRKKECSDNDNCDACEGDCDSDLQCKGNLLCFQRNGIQAVPGCTGSGTSGRDYCYEPTAPVTVTVTSNTQVTPVASTNTAITNIFGRLRGSGCSKSRPCGVCEGDCDNNDECAGNLICYQKLGPGRVPGCSGYDTSNTDFCVPP